MSWHLTLTCWDHELDGKIKALIASQPALKDNPASARALQRVQEHVLASLNHQPFGSRFIVESSGHYDSTGAGDHRVSLHIVTKEQAERTDRILAEAGAPSVSAPSVAAGVVTPPPAPTVDNTTHPIVDPNLEDVPPTGGA